MACALLLAQVRSEDDESALLTVEARTAITRGDYRGAAQKLERAITLNPRRIDAYVLRASIYAVYKQHAEGVALLERARELAPENPEVLTALGAQLMLAGRKTEGVPLLERVVEKWPQRYQAHAMLGQHYRETGQYPKAVASLRAYLETRPPALAGQDGVHRIELGDALLRAGEAARARELFAETVRAEPANRRAQLGLVWATAALDCRQAWPLLEQLAPLRELYPELELVQGRCALGLGRTRDAAVLARAYLAQRPDAAEGWALRGEALAAAGDVAGGKAALEAALRRAPNRRHYGVRLARIERSSGAAQAALARLRALGGSPADAEWSLEYGETLLVAGQPAQAVLVLEPAAALHPDHAEVRTALGAALLADGKPEAAVAHLERALALDGTRAHDLLVRALELSALALLEAGDVVRAERSLRRALALAPGAARLLRNLGIVLLKAGRAKEALAPLGEATQKQADAADLVLLARAQAQAGQTQDALATLKHAQARAAGDALRAAQVALERAAAELEAHEPKAAAATLEHVLAADRTTLHERLEQGYVTAARAAAAALMSSGDFAGAWKQLEKAERVASGRGEPHLAPAALTAVRCELALAAVAAGEREPALERLRKLGASATCPFPKPLDQMAAPILTALAEPTRLADFDRSLARLGALRKRATGAPESLIAEAMRLCALRAAAHAYARGKIAPARAYLAVARRLEGTAPGPELTHNLAVLDLEAGRLDAAARVFERVANQVPEALVQLALVRERKSDPIGALELLQRAAARPTLHFAPLKEWISSKQRLFGASAGSTGAGGIP